MRLKSHYDASRMENVVRKTFNRAIRSRTTHQSFLTHSGIYITTYRSVESIHSFSPQLLDNFFPPFLRLRKKNIPFSKTRDQSKARMSPLNSALTILLLCASLPPTGMTPLHNAKPKVRIALLFADSRGFTDLPPEGAANGASAAQTNKRYNSQLRAREKFFLFTRSYRKRCVASYGPIFTVS